MIPGSNLLNMAFSVIAKQTIIYYKYVGRTLNDIGQDITEYDTGTILLGSFQPVPKQLYELYGLDLQKEYFTFYVSANLLDIERNVSGDQIAFKGQRYQCESNNDWFKIDGWKGILCVHIGYDGGSSTIFGFNEIPPVNSNVNFDHGAFDE